jgi:hypothetical protein
MDPDPGGPKTYGSYGSQLLSLASFFYHGNPAERRIREAQKHMDPTDPDPQHL